MNYDTLKREVADNLKRNESQIILDQFDSAIREAEEMIFSDFLLAVNFRVSELQYRGGFGYEMPDALQSIVSVSYEGELIDWRNPVKDQEYWTSWSPKYSKIGYAITGTGNADSGSAKQFLNLVPDYYGGRIVLSWYRRPRAVTVQSQDNAVIRKYPSAYRHLVSSILAGYENQLQQQTLSLQAYTDTANNAKRIEETQLK